MSQDASAAQLKRSPNPAYVYGPMVYQFPPDGGGEDGKKPKGNQFFNFVVLVLIVMLVVGGVIIYLRENGIDIRHLSLRIPFLEQRDPNNATIDRRVSPVITQARVAADRLYLREGPGMDYVATYLLPDKWDVSLVGDYHADNGGEVWARVIVQTDEGMREGWVSRRFLE